MPSDGAEQIGIFKEDNGGYRLTFGAGGAGSVDWEPPHCRSRAAVWMTGDDHGGPGTMVAYIQARDGKWEVDPRQPGSYEEAESLLHDRIEDAIRACVHAVRLHRRNS